LIALIFIRQVLPFWRCRLGLANNKLKEIDPSTRRHLTMSWLRRAFTLPVHESKIVLVLMLCVVSMSLMSVALVWQAQIIASQREAIQWLQSFKFGG
jgi:hypothetical protein